MSLGVGGRLPALLASHTSRDREGVQQGSYRTSRAPLVPLGSHTTTKEDHGALPSPLGGPELCSLCNGRRTREPRNRLVIETGTSWLFSGKCKNRNGMFKHQVCQGVGTFNILLLMTPYSLPGERAPGASAACPAGWHGARKPELRWAAPAGD